MFSCITVFVVRLFPGRTGDCFAGDVGFRGIGFCVVAGSSDITISVLDKSIGICGGLYVVAAETSMVMLGYSVLL